MKITIITSLYTPYMRGGTERAVQMLIDELKHTHSVSIITSAPWGGLRSLLPKKTTEDGVVVYRFYPLNVFSFTSIDRMPFALRLVWHVIDMINLHTLVLVFLVLKKEKPDLVWTHNLKGIGYTVPTAIRALRMRHVHTLHDIQLLEPSGLLMVGEEKKINNPPLLLRCYRAYTRYVFGSPSVVIFPSYFLKNVSERAGFFRHSRTHVVPNTVPDIHEKTFSEKPSSPVTFFYFGQLEPHKGVSIFLDAIRLLEDENMKCVFAGKGSLQKIIQEAAQKDPRIEYKGFLTSDALRDILLREVHFSVLPTVCYENAPMSVVESLASGVPVIVSDIGGAAECVEEGKNGWRVKAGDTKALMETLTKARTLEGYGAMRTYAVDSVRYEPIEKYQILLSPGSFPPNIARKRR